MQDLPGILPPGKDGVMGPALGVDEVGPLLLGTMHLTDGGVDIYRRLAIPRSRCHRPGPSQCCIQNSIQLPEISEVAPRRNIPTVEGAILLRPSTAWQAPARSMSTWSM